MKGSCRFRSQLGASPWLVPRGHLALLHSPHISVLPRPYFLRRPTVRSCISLLGCGEQRAGERLSHPWSPAQVEVSAAASTVALGGWEEEEAEQKGACWSCGGRWGQPLPQHCYLGPQRRSAPRRPAPSRFEAAGAAGTGEEAAALGASARSAGRERGPRVSVSRAVEAGAIVARGHRELATPRLGRARGGDQTGPGAGRRVSAAFEPRWEGWGGMSSLHTHPGDLAAARPGPQRRATGQDAQVWTRVRRMS